MPFNEVNICPEYISERNFDKKHQVVLLKIGDDRGRFLALSCNLDEDDVRRPNESISRLLEGITSNNHGDF